MVRRGVSHVADSVQDSSLLPYSKGFQPAKSTATQFSLLFSYSAMMTFSSPSLCPPVPTTTPIPAISDVEDALEKALLKITERVRYSTSFFLSNFVK